MNSLLIGLASALLATNPPVAVSNFVFRTTGLSVPLTNPADPLEREFQKLLADDDAAQAEVDEWIQAHLATDEAERAAGNDALNARIRQRLDTIRRAYESFLERHPDHVRARLAYGSFLMDIREEDAAEAQWEKARQTDPRNPAAWNNLANHYGHRGPVEKAFEYYAKAIELNPLEPVYYWNLATTVYLFRPAAMQYYGITEPEVFDKALELYRKARSLAPRNFELATDLAQSYYGIKPQRTDEAIAAWEYALGIAGDDWQRQGVQIHLARVKGNARRFAEARAHLKEVTHLGYADLKQRVLRSLENKESAAGATNSAPADAPPL